MPTTRPSRQYCHDRPSAGTASSQADTTPHRTSAVRYGALSMDATMPRLPNGKASAASVSARTARRRSYGQASAASRACRARTSRATPLFSAALASWRWT
ncbi:hypothetical protein C1N81_27200 [Streptomyces sp. SGAir0957]